MALHLYYCQAYVRWIWL